MAEIAIEIIGLEELQRFFNITAPNDIEQGVNNALQDTASAITNTTNSLCPVDTGFMLSQIDVMVSGDTITAHAGADYSSYVDEGTSRMGAQPFFRAPIEGIVQALNTVIEGALARTGLFNW